MAERFEAQIGADIREFQRKVQQVDRQIRDLASGVDVDFDAELSVFEAKVNEVRRALNEIDGSEAAAELDLAYRQFKLKIAEAYALADGLNDYDIDVEIDAITTDFNRKLLIARAQALGLSSQDIEPEVKLNTRSFTVDYLRVLGQLTSLRARGFVARIRLDYRNFQANLQRIAVQIRAIGEIFGQQLTGGLIALLPTLSPIISVLIGLIANLGVIVGVLVGQLLILTSALSAVALGFVGLGAVAIPTIQALFDETTQLTAAQEQAKASFDAFKSTYDGLVAATEQQVLTGFQQSFEAFNTILQEFEPLIIGVADAFVRLTEAFNTSLDTAPIQAVFDAFNEFGPEIFENFVTGLGNFIAGLSSVLAALLPFAASWSETFVELTESFANFAAGLSNNEGFNNFFTYVQENLPLLSQAFGDFFIGLVELFGSFAPLTEDFIVRLSEMAEGFREFAEGLGENQQFQDFINFIRESTPAVLDLISNLTQFLINLGVAFAPVGAALLDAVNKFLEWTNSMLESSSTIQNIVGLIPVIVGGLMILLAPLTLLVTVFGTQIVGAIKIFTSALGGIGKFIGSLAPHFRIFIDDIVRLATSFGQTATKVISFASRLASGIIPTITRIAAVVVNLGSKALPLLVRGFALLTGPVGIAIAIITTLIAIGVALYKNWDTISAFASSIWNNIKSIFSSVVSAIVSTVQNRFNAMRTAITSILNSVKSFISKTWNNIISFLKGINLVSIGKDIIQGLLNGIKSIDVVGAVKKIGSNIAGAVTKFFKVKSPSRLMMEIGGFISQGLAIGITRGIPAITKATNRVNESVAFDFSEGINKTSAQFKQITNLVSRTASNLRGSTQQQRFEGFEEALQNQLKYNDVSLTLQRQYYLQFANQLKKGSAQQRLALKRASELQLDILAEQYQKEQDYLDAAERYEFLSLRDRIRAIQSYNRQYKVGSEQNIAYDEQLYDLKRKIYDDLTKVNEDYANEVTRINNDLIAEEQKLRDEYQKTFESRRNTLENAFGLFDQAKLTELITFNEDGTIKEQIDLLNNLRSQVNNLANFNLDLGRLETRGVGGSLLEDLRNAGPKAAAEIRALADFTDAELKEYQDLYARRFELAGTQAEHELSASRVELENQVKTLRDNAVGEIAGLTQDALTEVDELINGSKDRFNVLDLTLSEISQRASDNVLSKFQNLKGELGALLNSIAGDTANSLSSILGGNSDFTTGSAIVNRAIQNETLFNTDQSILSDPNINVTIVQEWNGEEVLNYVEQNTGYNTNLAIRRGDIA